MPTEYPDDSVQGFVDEWWTKSTDKEVGRGRLIRALVLYPDQKPYRVTPEGRGDNPADHTHARLKVEPFSFDSAPRGDGLPVAGLPLRKGESFIASRGKVRPCVVLSTGGPQVEKYLRLGSAGWQSAATMLVAPFYGADQDGSRGGWNPEFVERIRRAEYPQYMWDKLPLGGSTESILRLDHIFPIGRDPAAYRLTDFALSPKAMRLLDDWLDWLLVGSVDAGSDLAFLAQGWRELHLDK